MSSILVTKFSLDVGLVFIIYCLLLSCTLSTYYSTDQAVEQLHYSLHNFATSLDTVSHSLTLYITFTINGFRIFNCEYYDTEALSIQY